jgi:hypothetical protein
MQTARITAAQAELPVRNAALAQHPERMVELATTDKFSFSASDLADIQLGALRMRFESLVNRVPVLGRFAEDQGLKEICSIEDGALLLFPHTMYKSYPLSAIESGHFDRLTRWVATLTAIDLSGVDTSGCTSIDDWIDVLDTHTQLRLRHSSGTTGKLSFIPGSVSETYTAAMGFRRFFQGFGDEPDAHVTEIGELPIIGFGHRRGAMAFARMLDSVQHHLYGDDPGMIVTTNPGRLSADMLSLGGRLQSAESRGELGKLKLSPSLRARREVFMREQAEQPERLQEFFRLISTRFRGRRVILNGVVPPVVETAVAALAQGLERLFAPDSLMFLAGGTKGRKLPDDYPALVERFSGVPYPRTGFGMSEAASGITRMCPAGRYHILPNIMPYVIDPQTGAVLPRAGVQTGRFGFIDIAAQLRWGGFLSGDEITLNHGDTASCACGRRGAYIDGEIRRYAEMEGGDDKITCAGAPAVHENALQFMSAAVD